MKVLRSGCGCEPLAVERVKRRGWMRLLLGYRAYRCQTCGDQYMASKRLITDITISQRQEAFVTQRPAL